MTKLEIVENFPKHSKGDLVDVEMDSFWRNRIEDGSAKFADEKPAKSKSTKSENEVQP
jgi:hypothetical protein